MSEIIIDGVDVSSCLSICCQGERENLCALYLNGKMLEKCEKISNCYYKQLKRSEKENTHLKKSIEYDSRVNDLQAEIDCGEKIIETYKQALEEIREIVSKAREESGVSDDYFKRDNVSWKQHQLKALICKFEQITNKIDEVLNDRN